ncbi:hypothetical protein BDF20DRAFT_834870 [Mycotypha africana]|uniref:uncharacterized protein n=1 Tax=Mycotypha africana TaxID=64632 RepID=UPI00230172C5|nr:uncharacterized protein BDF20DRAFT_834870 [Mycotypha africana]KAI8982230.1 hypothetical protein BDF20DRAFT_834870 [Mycotypha africana]
MAASTNDMNKNTNHYPSSHSVLNVQNLSLTALLEQQENSEVYDDFILYLHQTYCIENLYFWQNVQRYKANPSWIQFEEMIENFILVNSPYEINIPCELREDILVLSNNNNNHLKIDDSNHKDLKIDCFDAAAELILELLRVNSFIPWSNDFYLKFNGGSKRNSRAIGLPASPLSTSSIYSSSSSSSGTTAHRRSSKSHSHSSGASDTTPSHHPITPTPSHNSYTTTPPPQQQKYATINEKKRFSNILSPSFSFPVNLLYSSPSMASSTATFGISRPSFSSFRSFATTTAPTTTTTRTSTSSTTSFFSNTWGAKSYKWRHRFLKIKERMLIPTTTRKQCNLS